MGRALSRIQPKVRSLGSTDCGSDQAARRGSIGRLSRCAPVHRVSQHLVRAARRAARGQVPAVLADHPGLQHLGRQHVCRGHADRLNRKQIMLWCNLGRAAVVALIPIAALVPGLKGDFLHLLLITLIFSAVGQLFGPAEAAVIPTILPRQALITANSMALLTMVLTLVVGGVLAPVVSRIDLYAPYWCAVVLLVLAGTLIFASDIPHLERHTESPVEESRNRFHLMLVDLQEGVDALRASRGLRLAFGQVSIAVLVLFNLYTLAPAYVSKVIGIAAEDTYVILGPATAGAMLSAVLLGQFLRSVD